jgi:putative SOS response-associated peptidase YedK
VESFTVITTAPNDLIAPMHDRMPAILDPDFFEDWLNPLVTDGQALLPLLKPYSSVHMFMRAVSSHVNSIRHDDPACLNPPGESEGPTGRPSAPNDRRPDSDQLDLGLL